MSPIRGRMWKRTSWNAQHADQRVRMGYDEQRAAHLYGTSLVFDIDHISNRNLFLENSLIYRRIQTQLFRPLCCFQANDDV